MTPTEQYRQARTRAFEIRAKYGLTTPRVMVRDLKRIYRAEGINRVDYWDKFKGTRLKGAYFNDSAGSTVVVNKKIIMLVDTKVFTLGHELKHHLMDEVRGVSLCTDDNEHAIIERAADVFAAELIYPQRMFLVHMADRSIGKGECTAEQIVHLKQETKTTLSHLGLAIYAYRLGLAIQGKFDGIRWNNLRDKLYPEYRIYRRHL